MLEELLHLIFIPDEDDCHLTHGVFHGCENQVEDPFPLYTCVRGNELVRFVDEEHTTSDAVGRGSIILEEPALDFLLVFCGVLGGEFGSGDLFHVVLS